MKLLLAPVGRAASVGGMGCGASSARHTPNFALAEPPPEPRAPQTPPSPQTPPAGTQSRAFDGALADDPQSGAAEEQAAEEGARGKDAIDLDVLDDPDRPPLHGLQPYPESVRRAPAAYSLRRNSSRPGSRPQSRGQVASRPVTAESAVSDGIEHGGEGEDTYTGASPRAAHDSYVVVRDSYGERLV